MRPRDWRNALAALTFAASIGLAQQAAATCTIYEHANFQGAQLVLRGGDDLLMVNPPEVGASDGIHRFRYRASWNDQVSSFKVTQGCTLTLWEHVNKGGHHFRSRSSYSEIGDWNDIASEAECSCPGGPNF